MEIWKDVNIAVQLGKKFNVNSSTIYYVLNNSNWKEEHRE